MPAQVALECRRGLGDQPMRILGIVALAAGVGRLCVEYRDTPGRPRHLHHVRKIRSDPSGSDEAERVALTKANEFCGQQGRQFVPNNMGQTAGMMNQNTTTGYTVTFKCLLPNDPAIAKYQLQPAPNVIIEQRNR
jgi:hypothetical protein